MSGKNILTFEETIAAAGLTTEETATWQNGWDISMADYTHAKLTCLKPQWIEQISREMDWPSDVCAALIDGLSLFRAQPALCQLLWHCRRLVLDKTLPESALKKWPQLPATLHPATDLFYAYVFLAALPEALAQYQQLAIPPAIAKATFSDLPLWLQDYRQKHGHWGLSELQGTGWLASHLRLKLFRLGRLQFRFEHFNLPFHAFRHTKNNETIMLLAETDKKIRPDGRFEGADGVYAGPACFEAKGENTAKCFAGWRVDPRGYILHQYHTIARANWEEVLSPDSSVLGIHIPAGAPLRLEDCEDSLHTAAEFFPRYFPNFKGDVFTCATWLFDSQLEQYLPPTSNIVRFLQQFYLFPLPNANGQQTRERVFGRGNIRPEEMPRDTSLQRIVADHILRGGHWYMTGGFYLRDDLPRWGNTPYRTCS